MTFRRAVLKDLIRQILATVTMMPISFTASAAVRQMSENATEYDLFFGQIFGMFAKYIVSPLMVILAAYIATKIKSAADDRIEDPKRTKFYIGIVAAFGVWFLAGYFYGLPFEARMPIVLTSTVLAPPILVNIYGYITELKTIASLQRLFAFLSRFKAAWDILGSVDSGTNKPKTTTDNEPKDTGTQS